MKPAKSEKFKKIKQEDLPELPSWWKETLERVKKSPLGKMSKKEKSQWVKDFIERTRKQSQALATSALDH